MTVTPSQQLDFFIQLQSGEHVDATAVQVSWIDVQNRAKFWSQLLGATKVTDVDDVCRLKGHFACVCAKGQELRVLTDAGGMVPVYYARTADGFVVGTSLLEVARRTSMRWDIPSVYDFIATGTCTHPHTWFEDIRVCEPGALTIFNAQELTLTVSRYFSLREGGVLSNSEGVDLLRSELSSTVEAMTPPEGAHFFFSGGEDSRIVAGLCPRRLNGYIFLEHPNREYVLARMASMLLGVKLHLWRRRPDGYTELLDTVQESWGCGKDLAHAHSAQFSSLDPGGVILGGWGADTLFKGLYSPKGKNLPKMTSYGFEKSPIFDGVRERRAIRFDTLRSDNEALAPEWEHFWPLSAHEHHAHFLASRAYFDIREPFLSSNIVQAAAAMRSKQRAHGAIIRRAVGNRTGLAGFLPQSTGRIPRLGPKANARLIPLVTQMFELHDKFIHPGVDQGPWGKGARMAKLSPAQLARDLIDFDEGRLSAWLSTKKSLKSAMSDRLLQVHRAWVRSSYGRDNS